MVFFVGRPETSPDSITQEWITTQRLIQKEASDKRDLVQTGQHLLKFMNVINSACSSVPNHGLRTPNECKNQRNLKIRADVADKV